MSGPRLRTIEEALQARCNGFADDFPGCVRICPGCGEKTHLDSRCNVHDSANFVRFSVCCAHFRVITIILCVKPTIYG